MILDVTITNKISFIPTFNYGKVKTNKKEIYKADLKWLMFDIVFRFNKNN